MKGCKQKIFTMVSVIVVLACITAVPIMAGGYQTGFDDEDLIETSAPDPFIDGVDEEEAVESDAPIPFESEDNVIPVSGPDVGTPTGSPELWKITVKNSVSMSGVELSAPAAAAPGQTVSVEAKKTNDQDAYEVSITKMDILDADSGELLFTVDGNEFTMPQNVNVKVVVYITLSIYSPGPTLGPPVPFRRVVVECDTPVNGFEFTAPEKVFPNQPVQVETVRTSAPNDVSVSIKKMDIYNLRNGDFLFTVEGNEFKMPQGAEVLVKVYPWINEEIVSASQVPTQKPIQTPTPTTKPVSTPQATVPAFKDVKPSTPHYNAIMWARKTGITKGYADGTFRPEKSCSRGDIVMFLWNKAGRPEPKAQTKSPFKDVQKTHQYYKAILWAYQKGITRGYSDGTFRTNNAVTRGEAVRFLWNMNGKPKPKSTKNPFRDLAKTYSHYDAVMWAYQKGITKGYRGNTFRAQNSTTRGEAIEFITNHKDTPTS